VAEGQGREHAPGDYLYDVGGAPSAPPYRFSGVSIRVFPLRASLARLREFCDRYLNVFPGVAQFRPLDAFVELVVLEYPSITSVEQPAFATYGQTEVFFLVPVSWKDVATGRTRVAAITPYIFVDNPTSARIGRDLFGWPKEAAWYKRDGAISAANAQLLAIDKETLCDGRVGTSRLLEVDDNSGRERFSFGKRRESDSFSFDLDGLLHFAGRPWRAASRGLALWNRGLRGLLSQWKAPTEVLNVNLKQSPQLDPEGAACYQALTVTPLCATRLNSFGLIGERRQLLGDPSGGCVVRVFEDPTWPVVTQLGLTFDDVIPETPAPGSRVAYRFRPVFPLWLSADFDQRPSQTLASRGTPAGARDGSGERAPMVNVLGSRSLLGTTRDMSFSGVRVQLFHLSADPVAQGRWLDALNGLESEFVFALSGPASVVLSVTSFTGMRSARLSLADWHETLVELYVPVEYRRRDAAAESARRALFGHAGFATSSTLSNTIHDSLGGNVMLASMTRGDAADVAQGIDNQLHVFRLSTTVVPRFQLGDTARVLPVIDVFGRPRGAAAAPGETAAALDVPAVPLLRLKQLPSAEDPEKSSYQALVETRWQHARGSHVDVGVDHELRIFEYDSLRLVERLGLQATEVAAADGPRGSVLRRPFAESLFVLSGEVSVRSEVLWERRSR
jgi:hypothetical protein